MDGWRLWHSNNYGGRALYPYWQSLKQLSSSLILIRGPIRVSSVFTFSDYEFIAWWKEHYKKQPFYQCLHVGCGPLSTWLKYETDIIYYIIMSVAIVRDFLHYIEPTCGWQGEAIVVVVCVVLSHLASFSLHFGLTWAAGFLCEFYWCLCGTAFVIHQISTTK